MVYIYIDDMYIDDMYIDDMYIDEIQHKIKKLQSFLALFFATTLQIWASGGHVVQQVALKVLFSNCQLNFDESTEFSLL